MNRWANDELSEERVVVLRLVWVLLLPFPIMRTIRTSALLAAVALLLAACNGSSDDGNVEQDEGAFTAAGGRADPEAAKERAALESIVASKEWSDGKTSLKLTDRTARRFALEADRLAVDGTWEVDVQESSGSFGPLAVVLLKVSGGREISLMISPDTCPSTRKPARALVAPGPSPDEATRLFDTSECAPKK
jgi:hypothetical protein